MLINVSDLEKGRTIYVLVRNENDPQVIQCRIVTILKNKQKQRHYLKIISGREEMKILISGRFVPKQILSNSIFFNNEEALSYLYNHYPKERSRQ